MSRRPSSPRRSSGKPGRRATPQFSIGSLREKYRLNVLARWGASVASVMLRMNSSSAPALELSESPNVTVPNLDPWRVLRETCDCSDTEEKARVENEPSRKHQRQGRHAQLEASSNIRQGFLPFFVGVFACQAPFHRRLHLNITGEARW